MARFPKQKWTKAISKIVRKDTTKRERVVALKDLRDAAEIYEAVKDAHPGYRGGLRHIARTARAFDQCLRDVNVLSWLMVTSEIGEPKVDYLRGLRRDSAAVAGAAESIMETLPERGPRKKVARFLFIDRIARVYDKLSPRSPGRGFNPSKPDYHGPFGTFVCEVIEPIDRSALEGIDDAIRTVLESYGDKPG